MGNSPTSSDHQGLRVARLLMVLSSLSPLFVLWAIKGNKVIPDRFFIAFCLLMVVAPNGFLWLRLRTARRLEEKESSRSARRMTTATMSWSISSLLLPFYRQDPGSWRDLSAAGAALAFIVLLFFHLNLHYMNVLFAAAGYRVFTVYPPDDGNALSGKTSFALITRRIALASGQRLIAYRLSDTVYMETSE